MPSLEADVAVIGGGMAGLPIANKAAYKGRTTVLFEKELLGGTCLNRGCIPTKTMLHSAKVAHVVRTARRFGIEAGTPVVDLAAIVQRKDEVLGISRRGAYRQVERNEHLTLIEEQAVFETPHRLRAGDTVVEAEHIIINTGARPTIPAIEGLEDVLYHTNRTLLDVTEAPESLLVMGGGYVGVEFAQMFARFGAEVTVLQRPDRLLASEDPDVSTVLLAVFRREGIAVVLGADVQRAEKTDEGLR
ncbi:MAG: FAD-dependent oxidoreductase, partial [Bacteroidetes bacterium]|nr:FAD-dependent oxidoreductase [Bacteroidota bacterium]